MAHEIEQVNGVANMMYAGEKPWHGLGQAVDKEVTAEAAIKLAGLDTEVELRPIYLAGSNLVDGIPVIGQKSEDNQAVVRINDNKIMGIVGMGYYPIQNRECFAFMDSIIGEGQAVYHTAGSLFGGKKIFLTVKLPNSMTIGPDNVDKYILMSTSHDGTMAVHMKWTPVRVVCANTLSAAFGTSMWGSKINNKVQSNYMIKHRPGYGVKITEAREALQLCDYYYAQMETTFNTMLDKAMSDLEMEQFAEKLFNVEEGEKVSTKTKNNRETLCDLFHNGLGNAAITNTKWAAYNSVTEYIDHVQGTRVREGKNADEVKFSAVNYGGGQIIRQKAFDLLTA